MKAINEHVYMRCTEYDKDDDRSVIINVGVFGSSSTYYVSAAQARDFAAELIRVADIVEKPAGHLEAA